VEDTCNKRNWYESGVLLFVFFFLPFVSHHRKIFLWIGIGMAVGAILLGIAAYFLFYRMKYHGKLHIAKRLFWSTEKVQWLLDDEYDRTQSQASSKYIKLQDML
jgi:uncharacterized membrane protein YukC